MQLIQIKLLWWILVLLWREIYFFACEVDFSFASWKWLGLDANAHVNLRVGMHLGLVLREDESIIISTGVDAFGDSNTFSICT